MKMEDGGWKVEDGSLKMEVENQRFEIPLEAGMEDGHGRMKSMNQIRRYPPRLQPVPQ